MKVLRRTASLFVSIIICASFSAAQQASPAASQKPSVAVANKVQLVIEGKVINVHDGDTVTVLDQDNKKFHIRLQGIDAPELKQAFGSVSQQNLSRMVLGKQVTIFWSKIDKYRRTVGTIMLDGRDMNIEQVKEGLAWHFKKYEDEQPPEERRTYAAAEQSARAANLGLWKDQTPLAPGDWRQEVKARRWGPPPPEGTIIGNSNSKKYHRPDCAGYRDMAERNRVFFKSVAEAEAAGYKRAGNCPAERQIATAALRSLPVLPTLKADPKLIPRDERQLSYSTSQGVIIGNKNSKIYHLPGCSSYNSVSEKNQVRFESAAEAEKAGFRLAGNCAVGKSAQTSRK